MAPPIEYVKVPKALYQSLERRASRVTEVETKLAEASEGLGNFSVTAVVTSPPSGPAAPRVLRAIQALVTLARSNT